MQVNLINFLFRPKAKVSDWDKQVSLYKGIQNQLPMCFQGKTQDAETEESKLLYKTPTSSHYSPKMCLWLVGDNSEIKSKDVG